MSAQQLLVRLPADLIHRLKQHVPARSRSAFVQSLLERALPEEGGEDDPLYCAALAVEQDERLTSEMRDWDVTIEDGLTPEPPPASRR